MLVADRCILLIKERANPGKLRKIAPELRSWENFPTNNWRRIPHGHGNIRRAGRVDAHSLFERSVRNAGQASRRVAGREDRRPEQRRERYDPRFWLRRACAAR